ncbi:MAG: hypothetical protein WD801_09640 [Gemmatimonadaceae bacterium]
MTVSCAAPHHRLQTTESKASSFYSPTTPILGIRCGTYGHVYGQIDPLQLGAIERAMRIAVSYGEKLARKNLVKDAIERLVTGYPSHEFVIDLAEAKTLFQQVREPTDTEEQLGECMSFVTRDETDDSYVELLNPPELIHAESEPTAATDNGTAEGEEPTGGGTNHKAPSETDVSAIDDLRVPASAP